MKNVLSKIKESLGGILVSLLLSLMLAFYEPLNMYVGNLDDFWFDIYSFFPIILLQFLVFFLILSAIFIIINMISRKFYKLVLVIVFIATLATYIQGNYLTYSLPGLDGNLIDWSVYGAERVVSCVLWIVVIAISLFVLYRVKFDKFDKIIKGVSVAILLMLSVASISLFMRPHVFDKKDTEVAMFDNFDSASRDKNFLIFLVDQVDSVVFNKELSENWDKREIFKDFTYYPNTSSTYLWTIFSIPYILSGEYYENQESQFSDYFTKAIDDSELLSSLESNGYKLNIYEDEELLNYKGEQLGRFENIQPSVHIKKRELVKQEIKYVLFKYLPYQLKWIAKIENLDINRTKSDDDGRLFESFNDVVYGHLENKELEVVDDKYFSFVHVVGAHPPFVYDKNVDRQPEGTYEDGVNASIAMIKKYLERLRENDVYDNSVIIIMSDHGHGDETIERSNPILYIKGFDEKHDYDRSEKKISYENLNDAYMQLLNGDKTEQLFINIDNSRRRILYNELYNPNLTEMIQTGDAWDTDTIIETGNKYLREK